MIKLQIIGHLGKDCVVSSVNGKTVINFSICHTEKYRDAQGAQKDKSTWCDASFWTEKTAIAPYLKKGGLVYVEGTPDVKTYTTQNGTTNANLTLRVISVQLLGGNQTNQQSQPTSEQNFQSTVGDKPTQFVPDPIDDLPF